MFTLSEDMYAQESIDLLQKSGIQFPVHDDEGIEPFEFAELITTSGVVLMDDVKWISFHRWVRSRIVRKCGVIGKCGVPSRSSVGRVSDLRYPTPPGYTKSRVRDASALDITIRAS